MVTGGACRARRSVAAAETQHEVQRRLLLDVVIRKGAAVLELLARDCEGEAGGGSAACRAGGGHGAGRTDEALLVGRDPLLVLDLRLHVLDRVGRLHLQSHRLPRQRLDEAAVEERGRRGSRGRVGRAGEQGRAYICMPPRSGARGEASTPSGCCSRRACGHLYRGTACQTTAGGRAGGSARRTLELLAREEGAGSGGSPPCPGSSPSRSRSSPTLRLQSHRLPREGLDEDLHAAARRSTR